MKHESRILVARIACAAALALIAWVAGSQPELFMLERSAIEQGELWRLWTGHLVHGNATHFAYDVGAAALLCLAFGPSARLLWMAPLIALGLLFALPDVQYYYGLSACLHGWVVAITLDELRASRSASGARRWLAAGLLAGTLAKALIEAVLARSVLTSDLDFGGPVLHASHLVGAVVGLLPAVLSVSATRWKTRRATRPSTA